MGGSAGHASHTVNDFRKICAFEAYAPTDNVSELTARVNDEGWDTTFSEWLKGSRLSAADALLVFSVGGGDREQNVSANLVRALDLATDVGTPSFGIVGRAGGYTRRVAEACVVIPPLCSDRVTPHTEGICAVILASTCVASGAPEVHHEVGVAAIASPGETLRRFFIIGGAGFIGSHFSDRLLADDAVGGVTIYDNFSSGREWHLAAHEADPRLRVVRGDVKDLGTLTQAMAGHDVVVHLASNPDIARAATEPSIDFYEGSLLTHQVVEAMRISATKRVLYASGSGVYGDLGETEPAEDYGPLVPVSTYGASKLAGEALISAYGHMFDMKGCVFRFGNVVGPRQTHGIGFDFVRRLLADPANLRILGDGTQSKSYIHVSDVVEAALVALNAMSGPFAAYNVATEDYITVSEIADLAVECLGLVPSTTTYEFTGGDRGWKGDVPVVRLSSKSIRDLGWSNKLSSREALQSSMRALIPDARAGRL